MKYAPVEEAVAAIANGDMVLVVDDEKRENEGDLIVAAEKVTSEHIAFMVRYTSGLICLPMIGERLDELGLPLMVRDNTDSHKTAFTVSIDLAEGTTTGKTRRFGIPLQMAFIHDANRRERISDEWLDGRPVE